MYDTDSSDDDDGYGRNHTRGWDHAGRVTEGMHGAKRTQTRFSRMPQKHLSKECVAGFRDMTLGRMDEVTKQPVGAPILRFDRGNNWVPHLNVEKRVPGVKKPLDNIHVPVPAAVVKTADVLNKTLRYAGITLTVAAVALDAWRIYRAVSEDLYVREHRDEIIAELEDALRRLDRRLGSERDPQRVNDIQRSKDELKCILRDVKRSKRVLVNTVKTASSIGGGWGGAFAGGASGAWGGAQVGTAMGSLGGPIGMVVGAPVGAMVGAVAGGIGGGYAGSCLGEYAAEGVLRLTDDEDSDSY